jgi:hypothetical protein
MESGSKSWQPTSKLEGSFKPGSHGWEGDREKRFAFIFDSPGDLIEIS